MENRLKEVRTKKGLSLEQVGKAVGLATNTISRYETGKREPKLETWQKLADFFGVSVSYLQGIEKDYSKPTEQTFKKIVDVLNYCYFGEPSDKDVFEVVSTVSAINSFAMYAKIDLKKFKKDSSNKTLWSKYFKFIFTNQKVIEVANKVIDKKEVNNFLILAIEQCINSEEENRFYSTTGAYIHNKYRNVITKIFFELDAKLQGVHNIEDVSKIFDKTSKDLNIVQKNIEKDINSEDIRLMRVLLAQPIKYTEQAKKLYKKDNEFKEFCDNSDYIAMSKIYAEYLNSKNKGIAELNKIISDNPILNTKEKDL